MDKPISRCRKAYDETEFSERDAADDPVIQFDRWFDLAMRAGITEPNAMSLATVDAHCQPAVRMVLLKGFNAEGFIFYTNRQSRKGLHLASNPRAAACLYWEPLAKQVTFEGRVELLSDEESDAYFETRPRDSQLASWASRQSEIISGRKEIEKALKEADRRYRNSVPRPEHWGGFRIVPARVEFWQGRDHRLHDRLCYHRTSDGGWTMERLSP